MANSPNRLVTVPPGASNFLATREEYIGICNGDVCAAQLLGFFEAFSAWRLEKEFPDWDWCAFTQQELVERLHHTWGLTKVKQRLMWLRDMGYIEARHNPRYKYDRRTQYRFVSGVVQAAIDYWWAGESAGQSQPVEQSETANPLDENDQSISRIRPMDQSETTNRLDGNDQSESLESLRRSRSADLPAKTSSSSSPTRAQLRESQERDDDDDTDTEQPQEDVSIERPSKIVPFRDTTGNAGAPSTSPPSSAPPPLRPARGAAVATYEADIGRAGASVVLEIEQAVLQHGEVIVIEAIKKAARYGAKSWSYVEAMLASGEPASAGRGSYLGGQYADWVVH